MIALHPISAPRVELPPSRLITPIVGPLEAPSPGISGLDSAAMARTLAGLAILDVSHTGTIGFATKKASSLLLKYFPATSRSVPPRVPELLLEWLKKRSDEDASRSVAGIIQQGSDQLLVRITGREDGHYQLQLDERSDVVTTARLTSLGLTRKEAEVLLWITRGKTDADIATILGCSPRTVNKHTEQIRSKLGVETRTAAAAVAQELIN